MKKIIICLFLIGISIKIDAQVYVKYDATGLNNGTSWKDAFVDLDSAINVTSSSSIWVSAGIYKPSTNLQGETPSNEREKTFRLKENIAIYGGFSGSEINLSDRDWNLNKTILSGDIGIEGDSTDNTYHVISAENAHLDLSTILDGLTIRDGYSYSQRSGAGIYVNQTSGGKFIIRNCIIEKNYSYRDGGGLYIFNSDPIIENNIFRNNQAFEGGGMYLYYSDAIVQNNEIVNNRADNYHNIGSSALSGGGMYIFSYSSPTLKNNLIQSNFARYEGGGVTINSNYHTVFEGNQVLENTSENGGGLFLDYSWTFFFNNVFAKNIATERGGGIYMDYTPKSKFINNTVVENEANIGGGGLYLSAANVDIINSIFYSNIAPTGNQVQISIQRSDWFPKIHYCSIENGENGISSNGDITYENNVSFDPSFKDHDNHPYELSSISELIDMGTTSSDLISTPWVGSNGQTIEMPIFDIIENPRIFNNLIDIGAYEAQTMRQYKPTDISLSNNQIEQSAETGTLIGYLSTSDEDSEEFQYEIISDNQDCFKIEGNALMTNCELTVFNQSPVIITIVSSDDQGWSVEKSFSIELLNIVDGIDVETQSNSVLIYPNPSKGFFYLENHDDQVKIDILSMDGKKIYSNILSAGNSKIDLTSKIKGVYNVIITRENEIITKKLIME